MFYGCFFHFYFPARDLRAPSADRPQTLPHDRKFVQLYNPGRKIRGGGLAQRIAGQKRAEFDAISDNFRLRSRIFRNG